ncbi:MAG: hypothetical protein M1831_001029 [Alyxoria varia]|nr:MAG: hypothetical protein M1831_001029 [Alyxoria varia]
MEDETTHTPLGDFKICLACNQRRHRSCFIHRNEENRSFCAKCFSCRNGEEIIRTLAKRDEKWTSFETYKRDFTSKVAEWIARRRSNDGMPPEEGARIMKKLEDALVDMDKEELARRVKELPPPRKKTVAIKKKARAQKRQREAGNSPPASPQESAKRPKVAQEDVVQVESDSKAPETSQKHFEPEAARGRIARVRSNMEQPEAIGDHVEQAVSTSNGRETTREGTAEGTAEVDPYPMHPLIAPRPVVRGELRMTRNMCEWLMQNCKLELKKDAVPATEYNITASLTHKWQKFFLEAQQWFDNPEMELSETSCEELLRSMPYISLKPATHAGLRVTIGLCDMFIDKCLQYDRAGKDESLGDELAVSSLLLDVSQEFFLACLAYFNPRNQLSGTFASARESEGPRMHPGGISSMSRTSNTGGATRPRQQIERVDLSRLEDDEDEFLDLDDVERGTRPTGRHMNGRLLRWSSNVERKDVTVADAQRKDPIIVDGARGKRETTEEYLVRTVGNGDNVDDGDYC